MLTGIVCGKGGQGVISINQMLGQLASNLGDGVISAETHGMAMRGGSVATLIKIGDFRSPSIGLGEADFILATDMAEARRNFGYLRPGGTCLVNATETGKFPDGYRVVVADAAGIAQAQAGSTRYSGLVLVGMVAALFGEVFPEERSLEILSGFKKTNMDAVRAGLAAAKQDAP